MLCILRMLSCRCLHRSSEASTSSIQIPMGYILASTVCRGDLVALHKMIRRRVACESWGQTQTVDDLFFLKPLEPHRVVTFQCSTDKTFKRSYSLRRIFVYVTTTSSSDAYMKPHFNVSKFMPALQRPCL